MKALVLGRLVGFLVRLLVAALLLFLFLDLLPASGDMAPEAAPPAWQRLVGWLGGMASGDFGVAAGSGPTVAERLAVTLPLAAAAMVLALGIGLPAGFLAARRRGTPLDTALRGLAQLGVALPAVWLGMLLLLAFSAGLHWLPAGGFVPWQQDVGGALVSLLLPALALALPLAALLAQALRRALLEPEAAGVLRGARARGMTQRQAALTHGLRNAVPPVLEVLRRQFGLIVAGTVVIENVFYLPGLGPLILAAVAERDAATVRGALMALILAAAAATLIADLLAAWADPRAARPAR